MPFHAFGVHLPAISQYLMVCDVGPFTIHPSIHTSRVLRAALQLSIIIYNTLSPSRQLTQMFSQSYSSLLPKLETLLSSGGVPVCAGSAPAKPRESVYYSSADSRSFGGGVRSRRSERGLTTSASAPRGARTVVERSRCELAQPSTSKNMRDNYINVGMFSGVFFFWSHVQSCGCESHFLGI